MDKRGIKPVAAVEGVFFFVTALVWSIGENASQRIALIVVGWLLFLSCVLKLFALFLPMNKKYATAFAGISFALNMVLISAALTLFLVLIGFASEVGLFNDIFMVAMFVILAIAEAAAFICNVVDHVDKFGDKK